MTDESWRPIPGWPSYEECNACQGKKTVRPFDTYYNVDIDDIREFSAFLKDCGGFKIY